MGSIFENVTFLNESQRNYSSEFIFEIGQIKNLNEQIILDFTTNVPEDFKKEAIKFCDVISDIVGKTPAEGSTAAGFQSLGLKSNNAKDKIEKSEPKKCYSLIFKYTDLTTAAGTRRKVMDLLINDYKQISNIVQKAASQAGFKKIPIKDKGCEAFIKKGKNNSLYNISCAMLGQNIVAIYIRCLNDTEENKACLIGGEKYLDK